MFFVSRFGSFGWTGDVSSFDSSGEDLDMCFVVEL